MNQVGAETKQLRTPISWIADADIGMLSIQMGTPCKSGVLWEHVLSADVFRSPLVVTKTQTIFKYSPVDVAFIDVPVVSLQLDLQGMPQTKSQSSLKLYQREDRLH